MMGGNAEKRKHGEMLQSTIRAIICGPLNCNKINVFISLFENPNGVLRTCMSTRNRCNSQSIDISKICLHLSTKSTTLHSPTIVTSFHRAHSNSIFIFDDVTSGMHERVRLDRTQMTVSISDVRKNI